MTVQTTLDENTYYHALWIQNELYSRKMVLWLRIILILIVLALTLPRTFVDEKTDWFIRAFLCALVVGVHAVVSKHARRKMLRGAANNIREARGGEDLRMEYTFGEDSFTAVGPEGTDEVGYSHIAALAEDTDVFVIVLSKMYLHASRKSDLSGEDRRALASLLFEKTGKAWKPVKM